MAAQGSEPVPVPAPPAAQVAVGEGAGGGALPILPQLADNGGAGNARTIAKAYIDVMNVLGMRSKREVHAGLMALDDSRRALCYQFLADACQQQDREAALECLKEVVQYAQKT